MIEPLIESRNVRRNIRNTESRLQFTTLPLNFDHEWPVGF